MIQRRYSRQRELIYNCLLGTQEHPTAEMVYQWLLPDNPNLSRGTVYRNLKLLAEDGMLLRMHFPVERYDACTRLHPHFCCCSCGAVSDLELDYDPGLDQLAAQATQQEVQWHDLVFYGTCKLCLAKKKRDSNTDQTLWKKENNYGENIPVHPPGRVFETNGNQRR